MEDRTLIGQVLDFAIGEEIAAAEFYTAMATQAKSRAMRETFEGFAREEKGHKAKLEAIKLSGKSEYNAKQPVDLKIADYLVDVAPSPDLDYRGALIVAMKKEKAAFKLYSDLAAIAPNDTLKNTFLMLAHEEANHKLRFEIEYDDLLAEAEN
jgi:rubrerythrin